MRALVAAALLCLLPMPSYALVEGQWGELTLELRGNVRINQTLGRLAAIDGLGAFTPDRELSATGAMLRLMGDAHYGEVLSAEIHVFHLLSGGAGAALGGLADGFGAQDAARSPHLSYRSYDRSGSVSETAVDRAVLRAYLPWAQVAVGRQPINLATTSFFTPNDFFQPFSAQAFFRVYKPGVDAARVDVDLGELSQLTLLGVMGYRAQAPGERPDRPSWQEASVLARAATSQWGFEWSGFAAKVAQNTVFGGGLQGELLQWLGLRVEGHVALPHGEGEGARAEVAVGVDHRFESTLHLRLEYFYNGAGAPNPGGYAALLAAPSQALGALYLGRHYIAAGGSYELTPLVTVDAYGLVNMSDRSFQVAAAVNYSLLDEVDASVVASVPVGPGLSAQLTPPATVQLQWASEFGAYPVALSAELRAYF